MHFKQIPQIPVGADLSAFAGCSGIPLHLLKLIIGPYGCAGIIVNLHAAHVLRGIGQQCHMACLFNS